MDEKDYNRAHLLAMELVIDERLRDLKQMQFEHIGEQAEAELEELLDGLSPSRRLVADRVVSLAAKVERGLQVQLRRIVYRLLKEEIKMHWDCVNRS